MDDKSDLEPGATEALAAPARAYPAGGGGSEAGPGRRFSAKRKLAAVQRLLRGESLEALSRELNLPAHRLSEWRDHALLGAEGALKERERDARDEEIERLKTKVGDLLGSGNKAPWPEVRDRLNRLLLGWSAYFGYGTRMPAYRAVDNHVYDRVRAFLRKRHKVQGRGTTRFSDDRVFGEFGVLRLRRVHLGPPPCASR